MYSAKCLLLVSSIVLSYFISISLCKDQRRVSIYSFSDSEEQINESEKPVNLEWKGFQDPIRVARERNQKRPRLSFRSANARPIEEDSDGDVTDIAPEEAPSVDTEAIDTQTIDTQTQVSETTDESMRPPCESGGSCKNRIQELEAKRVEWLKKTVLQKLKLSSPPNVTQSRKIPPNSPVMQALLKEYKIDQIRSSQLEDDDMEDEIKSQKLISTARTAPFYGGSSTPNWFFFEFSPQEQEYFRVKTASLWYYVKESNTRSSDAFVELDVYRPYFNETLGNLTHIPQRHTIRRLNLTDGNGAGRWQHIPVTSIASSWLADPSTNFGVKLFSRRVLNLITTGLHPNDRGFKPFLEVQLVADHRRRKRNAPNRCQRGGSNNACCLHDFKINFQDIGWDWIIYPTSYNAKFCSGECVVERVPSIHSTIVQASQDRHVSSRPAAIGRPNQPRSCCVPTKYAALSMLYYDNNGIVIYSDVPDMEIRKCSCV